MAWCVLRSMSARPHQFAGGDAVQTAATRVRRANARYRLQSTMQRCVHQATAGTAEFAYEFSVKKRVIIYLLCHGRVLPREKVYELKV
jgi:hypothetical protein